jgi:hypothetical protein
VLKGLVFVFIKVGIHGLIRDFLKIHLKKSHVLVSAKKKNFKVEEQSKYGFMRWNS